MSGEDETSITEEEGTLPKEDLLAEHDIEALRTTQSEVRTVLDHQIQTFNDVDNKAAKTFRLEALLLGFILTAVSFLVRTESLSLVRYINNFTVAGVVLLEISFIFAISTYTITSIETGLGPNDIQRLIDEKYSEKEWLILLLRSEGEWMRLNERQQTINGVLITISHITLVLAILALSFGIAKVNWPF